MHKFLVTIITGLPFLIWAQAGGIRGIVMDQDFEVPLANVRVTISETGDELRTQSAGSFFKDGLMPGSYTLIFSANGYSRLTRPQVIVTGSALTDVNVELAGEYEEMDELVVRDIQLGGASEIGLLNLRMESSALMDSVGADLISRAGASDAAGALKLVSGTTVQDGKYAVVRGLPDRYVVSLLNGVRLPTSDPDKRAVQLDQYPSSLIESVQVVKSFTPDQQGDASGGAVDIVLRGIPEERVLKFNVGSKWNENDTTGDDFLSYQTSDMNYKGSRSFSPPRDLFDGNDSVPQTIPGSYGVTRVDQPINYSWGVEVGDRKDIDWLSEPFTVGYVASLDYGESYSHTDDFSSYKYNLNSAAREYLGYTNRLVPFVDNFSNDNLTTTELWDIEKSSHELNWSGALGLGLEHEWVDLNYIHVFTHNAEDSSILSRDTEGKRIYGSAPYRRVDTLIYKERDTRSDQISGTLRVPLDTIGIENYFALKNPAFDWKLSKSSSSLLQPDKRVLSHIWAEGSPVRAADPNYDWEAGFTDSVSQWFNPSAAWLMPFTNTQGEVLSPPKLSNDFEDEWGWASSSYPVPTHGWFNDSLNPEGDVPGVVVSNSPALYFGLEEGDQLGNVQFIWEKVVEDSDQAAFNYKWDFENWTAIDGFFKLGVFNDEVERTFFQQTLSNKDGGLFNPVTSRPPQFESDWENDVSDLFVQGERSGLVYPDPIKYPNGIYTNLPNTTMFASRVDIGYEGVQELDAWYWMGELPILDFLSIKGGARYEKFTLQTFLNPDDIMTARVLKPNSAPAGVTPEGDGYAEDVDYSRSDVLPSVGFDLRPLEKVALRFNWAKTVAKQQFKEIVPIRQREYAGAPVFAGNPALKASPVENIDFRLDYTPYPGGLISASFFQKDITDPIEYFLGIDSINYVTFATNYPAATVEGWEMEVRQSLGEYASSLAGMNVGGNFTIIEGELNVGDGVSRDVMEMPEFLYNLFLTYDAAWKDVKLGLFYTHQGDTLKTNRPEIGSVPAVYALAYGTLNFSVSMNVTDRLKLSFKAKNILNPEIQTVFRRTDEEINFPDEVYTSYTKGREYSIGMSYTF